MRRAGNEPWLGANASERLNRAVDCKPLSREVAETPEGPALQTVPPSGLSPTKDPDRFSVQATIPIKDLKPGDYVIRAVFGIEGTPPGKVMRTLRKVK